MAIKIICSAALTEEFGFAPYNDAMARYERAIKKLNESATARSILKKLNANPQFIINIIPTDGCVSMFMDEELNTAKKILGSVITWECSKNKTRHGEQGEEIGLIHEMGHAIQYMENRAWYKSYTRICHDIISRRAKPNTNIRKQNAKLVIENDNIKRHETPVAKELGQGWREKYD